MSKAKLLNLISKIKKADMKPGLRAGLFTGAVAGAGAQGFAQSQPGLRTDAAKEGLLHGAFVGASIVGGSILGKRYARAASVVGKRTGQVVFRRIRGRIVAIKKKYGG